MHTTFDQITPDIGEVAREIALVDKATLEAWRGSLSPRALAAVEAARFKGEAGALVILPGADAAGWSAAFGVPEGELGPWDLAAAARALPAGRYRLAGGRDPGQAALGWLLAHHKFTRYLSDAEAEPARVLLVPGGHDVVAVQRLAEAVALVRDLVNTPAEDLGPADLEAAVRKVARDHDAAVEVVTGDALVQEFPAVHAVGRAAAAGREPRLIALKWGRKGDPKLAIVGKGVCFDSGGLDIKSAAGMLLMKKDMGGAAHALALASLVMKAGLRVRLHLVIPAVENAIDGSALRPGDVISTRKGLSVEIGNTDAEGRLILCDALALACEEKPELILDFATLTGAARVALGPDLPALFANDEALASGLLASGQAAGDPLWRMPLWKPYLDLLKSDIADIGNASSNAFAGAVTAALYLEKFVEPGVRWAHLDTFAWMPSAKPGRPKGGEALGLRAFWNFLNSEFGERRKD
jgi:leucyl aminopeptidase